MVRRLVALLLAVGVVLLPLRTVAATTPVLIGYETVVGSTATTRIDTGPSLRPGRRGVPEYVYDEAEEGYDGAVNLPVGSGAEAVHAYDGALRLAALRDAHAEGMFYDPLAATTAAEGAEAAVVSRAEQIHSALNPIAQNMRTTGRRRLRHDT